MRIALIAPVWFPVPPPRYGGIERIVGLLADGLMARGHDVTLYAAGDSRTRARLEPSFDRAPSERIGQLLPELEHALSSYARIEDVDLIHDHTNAMGATIGGLAAAPCIHTVHGTVDGSAGDMYASACKLAPRTRLIAISESQRRHRPSLPWLATCHNALDLRDWPFSRAARLRDRQDFLVFLGRMGHDKGAHRAIEVARAIGLPLKIAAKCIEPEELAYFEHHVRPHLGADIEYLGEVDHPSKVDLLRRARALIHPIAWEEPFGLVMIEAMACGTPVVAVRRGSVPEIVEDGRSGFTVHDHREMPQALEAVDALDPAAIRHVVEERFSQDVLVDRHLRAYEAALSPAMGMPAHGASARG